MYKITPQRPTTCLPMVTSFEECTLMNFKSYKSKILLHLIDHGTKLSALSFVKLSFIILNAILTSWIQIYGAPESPLSNGLVS